MYGAPETETMPPSQYAMTLKASLGEAYARVRERTARQLECQKELYNQRVHGNPFKARDHVWVLLPQVPRGKSRKLYRPWSGPFVVVKKLSDVTYRVQEINNRRWRMIVHFNRLKPYKHSTSWYQNSRREQIPSDVGRQEEKHGQHYFGTNLEVVDDEVNEPVPPSTLGSPENVNQRNDQGIELPRMNRHYPQRIWNPPDRFGSNVRTRS